MSKPLRVALLGGGKMAFEHAEAIRLCRHSRLVAVADTRLRRLELEDRFGEGLDFFEDPNELLASVKPDVVHVVTPPDTHAELARAALEAGANVYVEKPFAMSSTDAERVIRTAQVLGLRVCAAHQILFQDAARSYRKELADIGDIVHVESFFSFRPVRRHVLDSGLAGTAAQLMDILPHPVYVILDALRHASDAPAEMLSFEATLEGEVRGIVRCGNALGSLVVSLRARPVESWLRVMGTNGMVEADFVLGYVVKHPGPGSSAPAIVIKPFSRAWQLAWGSTVALARLAFRRRRSYPGLAELIEKFHLSIVTQSEPPVSGTEILDTVRLCEGIAERLRVAANAAERRAGDALRVRETCLPAFNDRGIVLLTGGTGHLGRFTAQSLRSQGWRVRIPCRRTISSGERVAGVQYVQCDLADRVPDEVLHGVDVVLHLAAETAGSKREHERNTVRATHNLLEAMSSAGVRRIVNVSSIAVLKPSKSGGSLNEQSPIDYGNLERGPYVWAKAEAERLVGDFARSGRIESRTVRLGPLVDYERYVPPGRLGREVARLYVVMGRPSSKLAVCQTTAAAEVLTRMIADFELAPPICNLIEQPLPTRGELAERLIRTRPDLRLLWLPFWILRILSAGFGLASKLIRPGLPALDLYSAFKAESYDDTIAKGIWTRAR